ncbi:MAG: hypothetical protein OEW15_15125 [Nitrospirota bacterium]|nr:hypothetical protein [Nitrospirota bacterium]
MSMKGKKALRRFFSAAAAACFLMIHLAASAEQADLAVLHPRDRSLAGATISVVLNPAAEKLPGPFFQLTIGGERGPVVNAETMPHAVRNVGLHPGENRIVVTFFKQQAFFGKLRKIASQELTVFSGKYPSGEAAVPPHFSRRTFHQDGCGTACLQCHGIGHLAADGSLISSPGKACLSCHSFVTSRRHVHSPVAASSCTACHDVDGKRQVVVTASLGAIPRQREQNALCGRCHERTLSNQFTHGPVAAGLCIHCHDPHSGTHAAQLRKPASELCMECHEARSLQTCAARTTSASGGAVECTMCHDPHGSSNSRLLLTKVVIR